MRENGSAIVRLREIKRGRKKEVGGEKRAEDDLNLVSKPDLNPTDVSPLRPLPALSQMGVRSCSSVSGAVRLAS